MEIIRCESCDAVQPSDYVIGQYCVSCGKVAKSQIRCAWCLEWVPNSNFCRSCGCELLEPESFGVARMLKDAGVDRFTLAERVRAMPPEQHQTYDAIYARQRSLIDRCIDEARFCQSFLLLKDYAAELEEELLSQLPMSEEDLQKYGKSPQVISAEPRATLQAILESSPIDNNRVLAALALTRTSDPEDEILEIASNCIASDDESLATEATLVIGHWRVWKRNQLRFDAERVLELATKALQERPLKVWAALTCHTISSHQESNSIVQDALKSGVTSLDKDLQFSCALAIPDLEIVSQVSQSKDQIAAEIAYLFLAEHQSPLLLKGFEDLSEDMLPAVLRRLRSPLPSSFTQALLQVVKNGNKKNRLSAAELLCLDDPETLRQILQVAVTQEDGDIFKLLMKATNSVCFQEVVTAFLNSSICEDYDHVWRDIDPQTDPDLVHAVFPLDSAKQISWLKLAEPVLHRTESKAIYRDVIRVLFDVNATPTIRDKACLTLRRMNLYKPGYDGELQKFALTEKDILWAFDSWEAFWTCLEHLLQDTDALCEVAVYEWLAELINKPDNDLAEQLQAANVSVESTCDILIEIAANNDIWVYLRTASLSLLNCLLENVQNKGHTLNTLDQISYSVDNTDVKLKLMSVSEQWK